MAADMPKSRKNYEVAEQFDVRIPTNDPEVTLSADVYLPVTEEPVPALVMALPYRKDIVARYFAFPWFAQRGYGCLLVDLRGHGSSDGRVRPPHDPGEGDDSFAAIEWAARQPWCTGDVGMWGMSNGAHQALRAASLHPPHLRAIVPIMGAADIGPEVVHPDGARADLTKLVFWGNHLLGLQLIPPLVNYTSEREQLRWQGRLNDTPFETASDLACHGSNDPVWRRRAIDVESIAVPALCVGGWRDLGTGPIIRAYERLSSPKKLLVGPWGHEMPQTSQMEPIDLNAVCLRWWDHWLRGVNSGVMDEYPVALYLPGVEGGWRLFESWPPAKDEMVLAADEDANLAELAVDLTAPVGTLGEFRPDPTTGILGGANGFTDLPVGAPLGRYEDAGGWCITSDPLRQDLLLCGRTEVCVHVVQNGTVDQREIQRLVVRLTEVGSDGESKLITTGTLCPDKVAEAYRVTMRPVAYQIRAGRRLRLVVSDSNFPLLTPLPSPRPITISGVEIHVPYLQPDSGLIAEVPSLEHSEIGRQEGRASGDAATYTITVDPAREQKEILIKLRTPGWHTNDGHWVERYHELRSTVQRLAPEASVTTGREITTIETTAGETITVTAAIRCTQTTLWASGEVKVDDSSVFARNWNVAISDGLQHR